MPLALCCMSHSPLLNLPGPSRDLLDDVNAAIAQARLFVQEYDPELVVIFSPDHYNGFFYKVMPSFCIGMRANGVGDYGTHAGPLNVPQDLAGDCAQAVLGAGVDVAVSVSMDVDHGTVQPLEKLFGDATTRPVIPIFVNAIAVPLGPLHRCRALGAAVGTYLAALDKRVLVVGSGGLSHSPPVPTLAYTPEFEANHSTLSPTRKGRAGTSGKSSPPPHLVESLQLHTVCGVPVTMMLPAECCAAEGAAKMIAPDATAHRMLTCRTVGNDIACIPAIGAREGH